MAVANFIFKGSYTRIEHAQLAHPQPIARCQTTTYRSAIEAELIKARMLSSEPHTLARKSEIDIIKLDFIFQPMNYIQVLGIRATPPEKPKNGDCYFVSENPTGEWQPYAGFVATYKDNRWDMMGEPDIYIYRNKEWSWYKNKWFPTGHFCITTEIWNQYFSTEVLSQQGVRLHQQCYKFLKLLPEFKDTIDC